MPSVTVASAVFAGPGPVLALSAVAVAALMLVVWAFSVRLHDASIVDPVWGPAFVVVALVAALAGGGDPARRWLLLAMTGAWGLRLGAHLTRRKLVEREEDRRYAAMRERQGERFTLWSLWAVFGTQGLLVVLVSLPIQAAAERPAALGASVIPGVVIFLVGLAFEAIGDEQLRRFKAAPGNRGKVMDHGLWRYTRHPNYFGDACVWWGLWLVALPGGGVWWTFVGPAIMTLFLVRISGKAMLEREIGKRRPEYAEYIKRTSGFFPLPPRSATPES
jgi:steroid 5-alpha reductase family enzyme